MSSPYKRLDSENNEDQLELSTSKEVTVYNINGTCQTVVVSSKTTSEQTCVKLSKQDIPNHFCWSIVEVLKDEGLERTLESHEPVLPIYNKMKNDVNRILELRINSIMFDVFINPNNYYFCKIINQNMEAQHKTIQKIIDCETTPLHFSDVFIYDNNRVDPVWEAVILLIKDKTLFFAENNENIITFVTKTMNNYFRSSKLTETLNKCGVKSWIQVADYKIYTSNKKVPTSPTDHCLCLINANGLKHYIACNSKKSLSFWMCAMRLSKYGKQLRDNYRSFVKKQNDANEYEYNKKSLPNESTRSHVAMDFSGNVGRIVEDPKEALAIAQAETGSVRRSWRSSGRVTPSLQAAITKLENDIHLSQPWYHKNMTRDQAANVLNNLGQKNGVFVIRESKSKCGSYVLSYRNNGKIIHTPIIACMDPDNDMVSFSLDNGVTKFYDLLQLVEFYQLNTGTLPTRLRHYVVQVPVTE